MKILNSIKHALSGIAHVLLEHRNFKTMIFASIMTVTLGLILRISSIEWFFISWSITTVLLSEMVNTAVEHVIDLIQKKKDLSAKLAKDVAAGAVLISSIWAALLGAIIFIPKIIELF